VVTQEAQGGIASVQALEDLLTTPSAALVADLAALDGDVMVVGAAGKMGPTLATLAQRALDAAGGDRKAIAVARFSDAAARERLEAAGVTTIAADLHDPAQLGALPEAANIVYMLGTKFGTTGAEHQTWATNTYLAGQVAERFPAARWTVFSSGNVYPLRPVVRGGADESCRRTRSACTAELPGAGAVVRHSRGGGDAGGDLPLNYAFDLLRGAVRHRHQVHRASGRHRDGNVNVICRVTPSPRVAGAAVASRHQGAERDRAERSRCGGWSSSSRPVRVEARLTAGRRRRRAEQRGAAFGISATVGALRRCWTGGRLDRSGDPKWTSHASGREGRLRERRVCMGIRLPHLNVILSREGRRPERCEGFPAKRDRCLSLGPAASILRHVEDGPPWGGDPSTSRACGPPIGMTTTSWFSTAPHGGRATRPGGTTPVPARNLTP